MDTRSPYHYSQGLREGFPIFLAYLSVSFGLGISAVAEGIRALEAVFVSMSNFTSAGEVAGFTVMVSAGGILEMALTQLVINSRYALMGITLTQKLSPECTTGHRLLMSFGITDEIFALAAAKPNPVGPAYFYGLMTMPYIGWALGTALGACAGQLLPGNIRTALGILIYAMFVSLIIPPAKRHIGVLLVLIIAISLSCCIHYIPVFSFISDGFSIIICSVLAAGIVSLISPDQEA